LVNLKVGREKMSQIAAFFDVDGTLYRDSLMSEMFKKLIKYDIVSTDYWYDEVRPKFFKYDNRIGAYDDYIIEIGEIYKGSIKKLSPQIIKFIAKQIIEEKGGRVYTYTRDKILWHKAQGHMVITISGGPQELVCEISKRYGMDDYIGTVYLDNQVQYTGDFIPMWDSKSKEKSLKEFVEKYRINLEQSYAYGDTAGDFSMLRAVGHPTCINPTKELLSLVSTHLDVKDKITVIVERKDVVYHMLVDQLHIL
jgi:HAD superfamily hydrolase (TIGR01490 family)